MHSASQVMMFERTNLFLHCYRKTVQSKVLLISFLHIFTTKYIYLINTAKLQRQGHWEGEWRGWELVGQSTTQIPDNPGGNLNKIDSFLEVLVEFTQDGVPIHNIGMDW